MSVNYQLLAKQFASLIDGEPNFLANISNLPALINSNLPDLNWAGFYILEENELVLGPFQGKVACTRIPVGRGVCGSAIAERKTFIVPDVHAFPGHIACDCASNSEIVIPLMKDGKLWGVLDLDSPIKDRFSEDDATGLKLILSTLFELV